MREKLISLLIVSAFVGFLLSSLRAEQLTNVSASASSQFSEHYYPIYAVNGVGLSGNMHTNSVWYVHWLSESVSDVYFIIDLKKNYEFDLTNTLKVWNYNELTWTSRGIKSASFSCSTNSVTFINIASATTDATNAPNTFDEANGSATYSNYNTVNFNTSLTGRYIKITVNGGQGVGNYGAGLVGLSEVQAFGTFVSDPADFLGAQIIFSNVTASSTYSPATYGPTNLINGSGLTGLAHTTDANNTMWVSGGTTAVDIDFDLGVSRKLGAMRIWNWNYTDWPQRCMRTVDILVSDDPTFITGVITNYNDIELLRAPVGRAVYDNPRIIDMKGAEGRYVRISTVGNSNPNWGESSYVGLSEVQFFQAPPPAGTVFFIH